MVLPLGRKQKPRKILTQHVRIKATEIMGLVSPTEMKNQNGPDVVCGSYVVLGSPIHNLALFHKSCLHKRGCIKQ